jgi:RNA recognition motif-containing protein
MNAPSLFESIPHEKRNDDSNPQQGTGGANDTPSKKTPVNAPVRYSRPSLKVPPTAKDERKLFVGGLPPNGTFLRRLDCLGSVDAFSRISSSFSCTVTSEEFRRFFEQFGPVMDSIVLVDKFTNRSRGFGFVTFEQASTAKKLLSMGHDGTGTSGRLEMQGKTIEVKSAEPKESTRHVPAPSIPSAYAVPVHPDSASYTPYYCGHPGHVPTGALFAGYVAPMYYMPTQMEYPPEGLPMIYHPQPVMMDGYAPMPPPQAVAFVPDGSNIAAHVQKFEQKI